MFSETWILILTLCGIACVSWALISNRKRVHPPLPPGPSGLPVVGSLPFLDPDLHCYFRDLAQTYGPLFSLRLGSKIGVVVTSPSIAKEILKDFDVTFANHDVTAAGKEATYGGSDVLWMPYGPEWRMLRKVCVREILGSTTLDALYSLRKHEIHQMIRYLNQRSGSAVNVGNQMFLTAMNVLTSMLWGDTVKGDERAKLGADFRGVVSEFTALLGVPNVSDFFPVLARFDLQGIVRKMRVCAKNLDDIFEDVISRRRKMAKVDGSCIKDVLQVLMDLESKDSTGQAKTPFTMVHLKGLLMDIVIAGTDTTSNTVEYAMAEIVSNPEVMRRARQELENVVHSSNGGLLEESQILQLPYLQAIVKETLRLHPVVPLLVPHCPSESCIVGGYTVPKGSRVFINVWAIQRDPSLWEDHLEFKPERFLDGRGDFNGSDFTYLPFGSGRRICVGIGMAERMIMFSLASMLHYFDWKLPQGVEKVDLEEKFGITSKKKTPLVLIPSPRSSNLEEPSSS
ncbi:hypothetical protein V2J09_010350 [Rumex salicifolius]